MALLTFTQATMGNMDLRIYSNPPKPASKRGRLGKFLHIQHSAYHLEYGNLIQVKTAFMPHHDEYLGEFRGRVPTITFWQREVLIDSLRHVQGVHYFSSIQ